MGQNSVYPAQIDSLPYSNAQDDPVAAIETYVGVVGDTSNDTITGKIHNLSLAAAAPLDVWYLLNPNIASPSILGLIRGNWQSLDATSELLQGITAVGASANLFAEGTILSGVDVQLANVPTNDVAHDTVDVNVAVQVTDATGDNSTAATFATSTNGTDTTYDWTISDWGGPSVTGDDLSWTDGSLSSAAGGFYIITFSLSLGWD